MKSAPYSEYKKQATLQTKDDVSSKFEATNPGWRPANRMPLLKVREGFHPRWCNTEVSNILRKKAEGWVIVTNADLADDACLKSTDLNDGSSPVNEIRHQDLIAMMIPIKTKRERDNYFKNENSWAINQIFNKSDQDFKQTGVQTYAPKGQSGRIVIE